ncbi:RidA family protein [Domibacillus indicus]|uniref:RidA family protein n=1 Tax=Domibacillus indicus TaxID=1437523 RepID=UPI000696B194|nr:RidA family protein [Domibacillus indicus]
MDIEKRLAEMNIELPTVTDKGKPFGMGALSGNTVYLSGQTPTVNGEMKYIGTVGSTISTLEAQEAAKICTINLLAALKSLLGDLNRVKRIVKINGYVAAEKDFTEHPLVINAASDLLNDIFGQDAKHARAALGVSSLPGGCPVEIEAVAEFI